MSMMKEVMMMTASLLMMSTDCLVIKPTWNHVKFKKVPPARLDGRLSGEVEVVCSATGSPAPEVGWYRDSLFLPHPELGGGLGEGKAGESLGETVARLRIPCLTAQHVGVYECRARAGKMEASATMDLRAVEYDHNVCAEIGQPQIMLWRPTMMLEEGSTAMLPCRTESKDDIVKWSHNGEDVEERTQGDSRVSVNGNGDLIIHDLSFDDMGEYICKASNSRGSTQIKTFLYPLAPGLSSFK